MTKNDRFAEYKAKAKDAIARILAEKECQPILFVGAGLSIRYFGAPGWAQALQSAISHLPEGEGNIDFYIQKYERNLPLIGTAIAEKIHEWAWKNGKNKFPPGLFDSQYPRSIFLKHLIATKIGDMTPPVDQLLQSKYSTEIRQLRSVRAHAIVTTNYDNMLENIFPDYAKIVGQAVIRHDINSFGEIYKIHGTVEQPSSMVLTNEDYIEFASKQKYITAKLLTYLAEHPVFIFGYNLGDPNIASIIKDLGEIIANEDGLIQNIFYIGYDERARLREDLPDQHVIRFGDQQYRMRTIITDEFEWIFNELAQNQALKSINPKLVRVLAARTFKLIRSDIPRGKLEVNYRVLEGMQENEDELPNLLGITRAESRNESHPFTITQIAEKLGYTNWNHANKLIKKIKDQTGFDIRATDNVYYVKIKSGKASHFGKWSHAAVALLQKVQAGEPYELISS